MSRRTRADEWLDEANGGPGKRRGATRKGGFPLWALAIIIPGAVLLLGGLGCAGFLFLGLSGRPPGNVGPAATAGNVLVELEQARVGNVIGVSPGGNRFASGGDMLILTLRVTNKSNTEPADYRAWYGDSSVALTDDLGNSYGQVELRADTGFASTPEGHVGSSALHAGKPVSPILLFRRPVPAASHLLLRLPASNVGGTGWLWLKVPKERYGG